MCLSNLCLIHVFFLVVASYLMVLLTTTTKAAAKEEEEELLVIVMHVVITGNDKNWPQVGGIVLVLFLVQPMVLTLCVCLKTFFALPVASECE